MSFRRRSTELVALLRLTSVRTMIGFPNVLFYTGMTTSEGRESNIGRDGNSVLEFDIGNFFYAELSKDLRSRFIDALLKYSGFT